MESDRIRQKKGYIDLNKTKQKRLHTWVVIMAVFTGCLWLTGCGKTPQMEFDSAEEAIEALNTAENIEIYADLYSKRKKTEILADGKVAGYLKGDTVYIDGEEWFSIDYVTDEPINESGSTTYGYYDADGNCLGYAQEQYLDTMDGDREPFLVFLDSDGEEMDYCSSKGGTILFDWDGSPVGKGHIGVDCIGFFRRVYTNIYRTTFYTDPEAQLTVDFMDRMAMFKKLQSDYRLIDSEPAMPVFDIIGTIVLVVVIILEIGWRIDKWKEKKHGQTPDSSDPSDQNDTGEE